MNAEACTCWRGTKESGVCGLPAIARRGTRCRNGCWGEGVFDFACEAHIPILANDDTDWSCDGCREISLEMFPLQTLAASS